MKFALGMFRFFHTTKYLQDVSTSALATLRKKTGFTLANIRKALELNDNDPVKAEQWLREQAKQLGWKVAMKVQGRKTCQGLIGVAHSKNKVAMVEVNCETDFVAKNDKFVSLVELVTQTCFQSPILNSGADTNKVNFNTEHLGNLKANGESLSDLVTLAIGSVGESIILRRGFCYETNRDDIKLAASVHPPCSGQILLGRYASFVSLKQNSDVSSTIEEPIGNIEDELCKHVMGMNPSKIGDSDTDKPSENADDEKTLIYQSFLGDDSMTVGELIKNYGITILDFKRYQCGESETEEVSDEKNNSQTDSQKLSQAAS